MKTRLLHPVSFAAFTLASLASVACGSDPESEENVNERRSPILNATGPIPDSMGTIVIKGSGGAICHGVLVSPSVVLTAAHCFEALQGYINVSVFGHAPTDVNLPLNCQDPNKGWGPYCYQTGGADVYFHPNALTSGVTRYGSAPLGTARFAYDLAIIRLPYIVQGHTPAFLYQPANPAANLLVNQTVVFGGSNNGSGDASGTAIIAGVLPATDGSGSELASNRSVSPSQAEHGDSGGGALFTLTAASPPSQPFAKGCAPPTPKTGDAVLVGLNQGITNDGYDVFVPAYVPGIVDWIGSYAASDQDGDGICDAVDNCTLVSNPDQANCNVLAEKSSAWQSSGAILGDACDPAPCPKPSLEETGFVASASNPVPVVTGDGLGVVTYGRAITDQVDIKPILGDGSTASGSADVRFCLCRDQAGSAISDPAICAAPPFYCTLDPLQVQQKNATEVGGGVVPTLGQTYWHLITVEKAGGGTIKPYVASLSYPGALVSARWDYEIDADYWINQKSFFSPGPASPLYGPGSGLAGALWAHDGGGVGAGVHGLPDGCFSFGDEVTDNCSMSDGFAFGVAPDAATTRENWRKLPQTRPNIDFSTCPQCGDLVAFPGEIEVDPAPFVTFDPRSYEPVVWLEHGGLTTGSISSMLAQSFFDASSRWVNASEPLATSNKPSSPRALLIQANGTGVKGILTRSSRGFEVAALSSVAEGMQARSGFAAAWSRTADALFIVGGTTKSVTGLPVAAADAWTYRPERGWSHVALDARRAPRNAQAATFSHRDGQVWILDGALPSARILRINPASGAIASNASLSLVADMNQVWLTTLADGRVVLSMTNGTQSRIALLDATPFSTDGSVRASVIWESEGKIAAAPISREAVLSVVFEKSSADGYAYVPVNVGVAAQSTSSTKAAEAVR